MIGQMDDCLSNDNIGQEILIVIVIVAVNVVATGFVSSTKSHSVFGSY